MAKNGGQTLAKNEPVKGWVFDAGDNPPRASQKPTDKQEHGGDLRRGQRDKRGVKKNEKETTSATANLRVRKKEKKAYS